MRPAGRHALGAATVVLGLFLLATRLFDGLWQRSALEELTSQPGGFPGAALVVLGSALLHELLHAAAWTVLGRPDAGGIVLRPSWQGMGFAAILRAPVPLRAYRAGLALPALVLGGGGLVAGLFAGSGLVVLWGTFFVLESFADLAQLLALAGAEPRSAVVSLPGGTGCRLLPEPVPGFG